MKFEFNRPYGWPSDSGDFLKGFYHIWAWQPSWYQDYLNKLSFQIQRRSLHMGPVV